MNKVYIITAGDYSDYHICAVYSSLKKAKEVLRFFPDGGITTYDLDKYSEIPQNMKLFSVGMKKDGSVYDNWTQESLGSYSMSAAGGSVIKKINNHWYPEPFRVSHIFAEDLQHAIKIANEDRLTRIAEGNWEK